jgi:opacity protein-like surface antigen
LVGVAGVPFANRFFAYGKSGFYRAETEVSSALLAASDKNTGATFGAGVRFNLTRNIGIRAEWQRYGNVGGGNVGKDDVDVLSASGLYQR